MEVVRECISSSKNVFSHNRGTSSIEVDQVFNKKDRRYRKLGFSFNDKNKVDGLKLLGVINDEVITACFFDPQYRGIMDKMNYGNEGERQQGRFRLAQMSKAVIIDFIQEISRVLIKSGHLFLWIDKFHLCESINSWLVDTKLSIVDLISWDKDRMGMGYRTRRQVEYLLVLQKKPIKAKGCWKRHDIKDIWVEKIKEKEHTHQKPLNLQKALIEAISNEKDIILDPCAGSYSVLKACKDLRREFIGSDIV